MVVTHTSWTVHCRGCNGQMGDEFDNEGEAMLFSREYPLCSVCDGTDES